jgi:hypothetical protein
VDAEEGGDLHHCGSRIGSVRLKSDRVPSSTTRAQFGRMVRTQNECAARSEGEVFGLCGGLVYIIPVNRLVRVLKKKSSPKATYTRPCVGSEMAWYEKRELKPLPTMLSAML